MTSVGEVIKLRDAGHMRVCFLTHSSAQRSEMLKRFGLDIGCRLIQIDRPKAIELLTMLLHQDLAHGVKMMPIADAQGFASWLLEQFQAEESAFYTNWDWRRGDPNAGNLWPCTRSTFDGGVIATSGGLAACIWFEDED